MRKLQPTILGLVLVLAAHAASANAPAFLPVQGVLADAGGAPVDGDVSMRFALYTADVGGTELWNETQTVPVASGLFTVYLATSPCST